MLRVEKVEQRNAEGFEVGKVSGGPRGHRNDSGVQQRHPVHLAGAGARRRAWPRSGSTSAARASSARRSSFSDVRPAACRRRHSFTGTSTATSAPLPVTIWGPCVKQASRNSLNRAAASRTGHVCIRHLVIVSGLTTLPSTPASLLFTFAAGSTDGAWRYVKAWGLSKPDCVPDQEPVRSTCQYSVMGIMIGWPSSYWTDGFVKADAIASFSFRICQSTASNESFICVDRAIGYQD